MPKNTGIQYESLTQIIFNAILNHDRERVRTIEVKRDVTLIGKTTTHQIDVYWGFDIGGITYATVVQAKDWMNSVNQGELLKFKEVLNDLPGQPRGVFVTRTGYQEGALNYARAQGILLYELREPTETDRAGHVMSVNIDLAAYLPHTSQIRLVHDEQWRYEESLRLGLTEVPGIRLGKEPEEVTLFDQGDKALTTVKKLIGSLYPRGYQELPPTRAVHEFTDPTFIETGVIDFPKLKINAVEATITVSRVNQKISLVADDVVGFILRNVTEDSERILDKEGKPLARFREGCSTSDF